MDLTRLRYFLVLSETEHLGKAAELLGISPPALSKAVQVLEDELKLKLTMPDGRGLKITPEGRRIVERAAPHVKGLLDLPHTLQEPEHTSLRIGTFEVFSTYFMGTVMKKYMLDEDVTLFENVPGEMERALAEGKIDVGVTYIPIPYPGIEYLQVSEIKMGIFGRPPWTETEDFMSIPFVVPIFPVEGSPTKVRGLDGWPEGQVDRNTRFRVTLMESALEICRQGLGVGYFPEFVIRLHNEQARKEFALTPHKHPPKFKAQRQGVHLLLRKGTPETPAIKKLARALRMECK